MKINNLLLILLFLYSCTKTAQPRLLIKIPTQSNPKQFFTTLDKYYELLSGKYSCEFLITCNINDPIMNSTQIKTKLASYKNLSFYFSNIVNTVNSYNANIEKHLDFDILIVSDDATIPAIKNYDQIICQTLLEIFPDTDGVLNTDNNSIAILGKKYYSRFNYVYHPHYTSSLCYEEFDLLSKLLKKQVILNMSLFTSPIKNQTINPVDEQTLKYRMAANFNYDVEQQKHIKWSILVPTLESRKIIFSKLYNKLVKQIQENNLQDKIEIVVNCDNRQKSTGQKRNELLQQSRGEYVCYIDDDDNVSSNYIPLIYEKICKYPDCVSLEGIMTFNGKNPTRFGNSLKYANLTNKKNSLFEPPSHLNTMRRDIAIRFKFPLITIGEDTNWNLQLANSKLLKTEEEIGQPYYYYFYRKND